MPRDKKVTYNRKERVDGVFGRSDHVVASVEIGPPRDQNPIAVIVHMLATAQPHCQT